MKYLLFGHNLDKLFRYNKDIKEERSELDGVVIGRNFLADAAGVLIKQSCNKQLKNDKKSKKFEDNRKKSY